MSRREAKICVNYNCSMNSVSVGLLCYHVVIFVCLFYSSFSRHIIRLLVYQLTIIIQSFTVYSCIVCKSKQEDPSSVLGANCTFLFRLGSVLCSFKEAAPSFEINSVRIDRP